MELQLKLLLWSSQVAQAAKMENSSPCKIVTRNFHVETWHADYTTRELGTYYTIFDVDRFNGGFSRNR